MSRFSAPRGHASSWLRYAGGLFALLGTQYAKPACAVPLNADLVTTAILQAARQAAPDAASITLGPVQGAQFMQACTGAVTVTITGLEPYEQAAAHCTSPGWTLYVTVTVTATAMVVVTARPVAAGQSLQPQDLQLMREPVGLYAGRAVYYDPASLSGADTLMSLPAGTILTSGAIQQPTLVQAGQTVSVDVQSGGVDISILATADQSGRVGDTILMTNRSSGKRFTALVTAAGPVVQLPG